MYKIRVNDELSINSRLLLNSDKQTLEKLFIQHNVDPDSVDNMMRAISDWYQKEPHLPAGQLHDQFIARLLVMKNYSVEKVKQKIDNYYSVRPKVAEFLSNRDPADPHLNKYLKTGYWIVLPRRTPENHRLTIFRIKSSDGVSVLDLIKVLFMIADYRMWNDSVLGEHVIIDFRNVTLQLALEPTPVFVSKIIYFLTFHEARGIARGANIFRIWIYVLKFHDKLKNPNATSSQKKECLGPKIKGIHLVNLPSFAEAILSLCKKLLKPKIVKRIQMYKSFDEVFKKFPESIFPKDLGGTDDVTCQDIADSWEETFCSTPWRNFFIEQDSIRSDESKRTTIKRNFRDDFGLDGTFKKLSID